MKRLTSRMALGSALVALALTHWLLIGLATGGWFREGWWLAWFPLSMAVGLALLGWWRLPARERWSVVLVLLAVFLFLPPDENIALHGDAPIYLNEAAWMARVGALQGLYEPLAHLSPEQSDPFWVADTEQAHHLELRSYDGLLYGAWYLLDPATMRIQISRPPLWSTWLAFVFLWGGLRAMLLSTPLFAAFGVLMVYAVARQLVTRWAAVIGALLLAFSFPQIHFGRMPYAEIVGQFWMMAGCATALVWLRRRDGRWLWLTLLAWVTTWAARLDALLLLPTVALMLFLAGFWRDRFTMRSAVPLLAGLAALAWLGTNRAYVGSTYELVAARWWWFSWGVLALVLGVVLALPLGWFWGNHLVRRAQKVIPLLVWAGVGAWCGLVVWGTVPLVLPDWETPALWQEIIWFTGSYTSPIFFWLAALGMFAVACRGVQLPHGLLGFLLVSLSAVFLTQYTSAPVYPVSIRRLVSDVLPLMAVFGACAIHVVLTMPQRRWRWLALVVAGVALMWEGTLSLPRMMVTTGQQTPQTVVRLAQMLPADAVVWFETQDGDSWVGWLAAPLYAFEGRWALLLDSDTPDRERLRQAAETYTAMGRPLYLVVQKREVPLGLVPEGYGVEQVAHEVWASTMIGQQRAPYPFVVWQFAHPLYVYRLIPH